MQRERILWLDAAKGIAISLVVLGHMSIPDCLGKFIFAFHMPFFFLVAGLLQRQVNFRKVFASRFNGLVGPYVLWGIPSVIIAILDRFEPDYTIKNFIIGNGVYTTWFLSALLCSSLFGYVLSRYCKSFIIKLFVAFIIAIIGRNVAFIRHPHFLSIHTWAPATFFWLVGNCIAQSDFISWYKRQNVLRRVMTSVFLLLVGSTYLFNIRVSIAEVKLGCEALFYPAAVALSLLLIVVCASIPIRLRPLEFLGRNSLSVMVLHVLVPVSMTIIASNVGMEPSEGFAKWVVRIFSLTILIVVVVLIDRKLPALAGRKKWIS